MIKDRPLTWLRKWWLGEVIGVRIRVRLAIDANQLVGKISEQMHNMKRIVTHLIPSIACSLFLIKIRDNRHCIVVA